MRQYRELLPLTEEQRSELGQWAQSRTLPAGDVFRDCLILALADGWSYRQIKERSQTTAPTIARWKQRFEGSTEWTVSIHVTKGVNRASLMRMGRRASPGRRNRNPPTAARIGRAGKWPPRWE